MEGRHGQVRNRTTGAQGRGPALPHRQGPLRRRHRAARHVLRRQRAVSPRPRPHQKGRHIEGQGRARRAARADRRRRRGREARRHDRASDAGGFRRAQGPPHPPAAAGVRQGAHCRRPRRLRGRRDREPGARRRRAGDGRIRAAARRGEHRGRRQGGRAQGARRKQYGQHRVPPDVRQCRGHRSGLRQGQARGEAARREQPAVARLDGAASRDRRLRGGDRPVHAALGLAESARRAHGDLAHLPRAGESDPKSSRRTSAAASASRAAPTPTICWSCGRRSSSGAR